MTARMLTAFAAFLLLFTACAPAERDEAEPANDETADAPPAELTSTADRYIAAWNGDDPSAVAAFYTEDATAPAADTTFQGRADIEQQWVSQALPVISDLRVTESSFDAMNGDWREHGRYSHMVTPPDEEAFETTGNYRHDWTQEADGQWRISAATVEPDAPPQDDQQQD